MFSGHCCPLHALTRKGTSFAWTPECSEAFDTLRCMHRFWGTLDLQRMQATFSCKRMLVQWDMSLLTPAEHSLNQSATIVQYRENVWCMH